jgi:hypothetical protein
MLASCEALLTNPINASLTLLCGVSRYQQVVDAFVDGIHCQHTPYFLSFRYSVADPI